MRFTTIRTNRDVIGELCKHVRLPARSNQGSSNINVVCLAFEEL